MSGGHLRRQCHHAALFIPTGCPDAGFVFLGERKTVEADARIRTADPFITREPPRG